MVLSMTPPRFRETRLTKEQGARPLRGAPCRTRTTAADKLLGKAIIDTGGERWMMAGCAHFKVR